MRNGPKPLPFQLGMASMASAGLAGGTAFSQTTLQDFFRGIQKYQQHSFRREMPELPVVWEAGKAKLFSAAARKILQDTPVVLIPSLVNKSDILDLVPERSLLRWLAGQGVNSHLLDWGLPVLDPGQADMDTLIRERLVPALESLGKPALLLGYCMGGLLSSAVTVLRPDLVKGLLLLATPWNFHDEKASLKARLALMKPMAIPYMKQYQRLPESWMQAVFATLDPEGSIRKFSSFYNMPQDDPRASIFVAVEDWLNDGLDLPAAIALTCMEEWYENNLPYKGEWTVCGHKIDARNIRVPTFVIAASDDRIVPLDSAAAFAGQRIKGEQLICRAGHVGLIAGKNAIEDIWRPMARWFAAQQ